MKKTMKRKKIPFDHRAWARIQVKREINLLTCISELIDNSLDAKGSKIEIEWKKNKRVIVQDNGQGVQDLSLLVAIGGHTDSGISASGTYGIGSKDAFLKWGGMGSSVYIETVCEGKEKTASINWWEPNYDEVFSESEEEMPSEKESGTLITIIAKKSSLPFPKPGTSYTLHRNLQYRYWSAINDGARIYLSFEDKKRISYTSEKGDSWKPPKLEKSISEKNVRVGEFLFSYEAGIVSEKEHNEYPGLMYIRGYRTVEEKSFKGLEGLVHSGQLFGIVWCHEGFEEARTTNKQRLENIDEVRQHISDALKPLIQELKNRNEQTEIEIPGMNLTKQLMQRSQALVKETVEKVPTLLPRVRPPGLGGEKCDTDEGEKKEKSVPKVQVDLISGYRLGESYGGCSVSDKEAPSVYLYKDHPYVERALNSPDKDMLILHLVSELVLFEAYSKEEFLPEMTKILARSAKKTKKRPVDVDDE
jgi:hypothetical protein